MEVKTKFSGIVDVQDHQLLFFPSGVFGFEAMQRYALLDAPQPGFYFLQSLDNHELAFILINPYSFRPDFELQLQLDELRSIGANSNDDLLIFAIVTVPEDPQDMTANLQGPIIINRHNRHGAQGIQGGTQWGTRHRVFAELASRGA